MATPTLRSSIWGLLRVSTLSPPEAANVVAYMNGIQPDPEHPWTPHGLCLLLFLRWLHERDTSGLPPASLLTSGRGGKR